MKSKRKKKFVALSGLYNEYIKEEAKKEDRKSNNQRRQDQKAKKNAANKWRAKGEAAAKEEQKVKNAKVEKVKNVNIVADIKRLQKRHSNLAKKVMEKSIKKKNLFFY